MLQWEHSAILSTFIKLPFVIKPFDLSIFEWPLKTGFTVHIKGHMLDSNVWCISVLIFFISANSVDTQSNSAASVNQCKPVAGLVNKL